ncbi:MAG: hypothetical protein Kow0077_29600 [Anaerolineae bacterium]
MRESSLATQLVLLSGPVIIAAVSAAWVALGRLFMARWGGPQIPRWVPLAVGTLLLLFGLVVTGTQLIGSTMSDGVGAVSSPATERGLAALIALMLSPVWLAAASLAVLGIVLHYTLDGLLNRLGLHPAIAEGLACGVRAAWALISVLMVSVGLYGSYTRARLQFSGTVHSAVAGAEPYQLFLALVAIGVAVLALLVVPLMEDDPRPPTPPDADTPPPD